MGFLFFFTWKNVHFSKKCDVIYLGWCARAPVLAFFDLNGKRMVRRTGFANEKKTSYC